MGDDYKKAKPGDKFRMPAVAYNAFIDAARDFQDRQRNQERTPQAGYRTTGLVMVKNTSGTDLDRYCILGIDVPIYTPTDNLDSFKNKVAFIGKTPAAKDHYGRFVVLLEPLKADAIGPASADGICPVKVSVADVEKHYAFADVQDGSTAALAAAPHGSAAILWKESPDTGGEVWAVVRIGNPSLRPFALDPCDPSTAPDGTLYVTNDLTNKVGKVVTVEDICYQVRVPAPDELICIQPRCVEIQETYKDCAHCHACWTLTPCTEGMPVRKTNTDLAAYEDKIVKLDDNQCYTVTLADDCLDAEPVTVVQSYEDCDSCGQCYHLQNCHDETDTLVIDNDLAALFEETPEDIVANARVVEVNGQCYTVTAYDTDCPGVQTVTVDSTFDSCDDCGCFELTPCNPTEGDPPVVITTSRAIGPSGSPMHLRDYVGQVLRLSDGQCYSVAESDVCDALEDVSVLEAYDTCEACACWQLTDCGDGTTTMLTYSDLSTYGAGAVVRQAGTDPVKCWTITYQVPWDGSAVAFEVDSDFPDCDTCLNRKKYRLTQDCNLPDCGDGGDGGGEIITTEDLHAAVGLWVKVGGLCYQVAATDTGDVTNPTLSYEGPFPTCDDCVNSPVDATKQIITDLQLYGTSLIAKTETMIIKGGKIVGFCKGSDITIEGTDCPPEGA